MRHDAQCRSAARQPCGSWARETKCSSLSAAEDDGSAPSGRSGMTVGDHKLRIALAVFESAAALEPAIGALLSAGVPLIHVGMIASTTTAARLTLDLAPRLDDRGARTLAGLVEGMAALSSHSDGQSIVASPSVIAPWISGWRFPALWGSHLDAGDEPRLAPDLERHVKAGSAILTVESRSLQEQWQCTRILLAQSTTTVLALECSLLPHVALRVR